MRLKFLHTQTYTCLVAIKYWPRSSKFTQAAHLSGIIFSLVDSVGNPLQYKCCHGTHTRHGTSAIAQFIYQGNVTKLTLCMCVCACMAVESCLRYSAVPQVRRTVHLMCPLKPPHSQFSSNGWNCRKTSHWSLVTTFLWRIL